MADKLKNKVAVITGGTTGIGFATAKRFIDEGATVVITGTNPKTLEAARSELGGQADVVASDAAIEKDVKALFDHVVNKHGKIDVLFLNAGIARFAPWEQHSEADFDLQFAINVKGPWLAIKHAIPVLNDGASIIATTSVANQLGMFRLAYLVEDARAACAELDRLGVSHSGAHWLELGPELPVEGVNAVFFRDPDGACLELIERPHPQT